MDVHTPTYEETVEALKRAFEQAKGWYWYDLGYRCSRDGHKAVENGTQRSWCKHCNIDMIFEWKENKYVVVLKNPCLEIDLGSNS